MRAIPSIYIYPITPSCFGKGTNNYILKVKDCLGQQFRVVNSETTLGLVDIILKLFSCDIIYFNWIEDLPDRKWGYFQALLLPFVLLACKISGIQIVWFVHNNLSHFKKNILAKSFIRRVMLMFSDHIFSHSAEAAVRKKDFPVFEHPVEENDFIELSSSPSYDLLIWGTVSEYKGVIDFLEYNHRNPGLRKYRILVAGKFNSTALYEKALTYKTDNVEIRNEVFEEEELQELFRQSRYILFCYNSGSVLSSAALCQSLSYGKTVIGPCIGSFKELGAKGLLYNYQSFDDLCNLVQRLKMMDQYVDQERIRQYIGITSWPRFKEFLSSNLHKPEGSRRSLSRKNALS